jgi:hypothetical protein
METTMKIVSLCLVVLGFVFSLMGKHDMAAYQVALAVWLEVRMLHVNN